MAVVTIPNFTGQLGGLAPTGVQADRLGRREEEATFRQEQMAALEQALADRDVQAGEVERSLQLAGLSDVAERFRQASKQGAFNAARRGFSGGSADIQRQAQEEANANSAIEDVFAQAAGGRASSAVGDLGEMAGLSGQVIGMDPFEQAFMGSEQAGFQAGTSNLLGQRQAQMDIEAARRARRSGLGGAIGGALGGIGSALGTSMQMGAR
jgi:hypothetical protein